MWALDSSSLEALDTLDSLVPKERKQQTHILTRAISMQSAAYECAWLPAAHAAQAPPAAKPASAGEKKEEKKEAKGLPSLERKAKPQEEKKKGGAPAAPQNKAAAKK